MDWRSVASFLAERNDRPVALLDGAGKFVLLNSAMEALLGRRGDELEGRSFAEKCVPAERSAAARQWLKSALSGARTSSGCEILTADQRRLAVSLETALVGRGAGQGLLVAVAAARPAGARDLADRELDYEIAAGADDFGKLARIAGVDGTIEGAGARCYDVIHARPTPCDDCPIRRSAAEPWPRTAVRRRESACFELLTAQPEAGRVRVSVRLVPDRALSAIQQARIDGLAEKGRLSERERAVLRQLLDGRTLDDIAAALHLSRRTVKFHQANLLQKLGVDSRVDLLRILGF